MHRKFLLQPPLSLLQSRTGPKESRRTSRLSKEEEVISSSLQGDTVGGEEESKESQSNKWHYILCSCLINWIKTHSSVKIEDSSYSETRRNKLIDIFYIWEVSQGFNAWSEKKV